MRIAIMQPYFFPYIGYLQLLNCVDKFVVYDTVNFIKKGWIHRVRTYNRQGDSILLTIPLIKASQNRDIRDIKLHSFTEFSSKFLQTIKHTYARAPFFPQVFPFLQDTLDTSPDSISDLDVHCLRALRDKLGMATKIISSSIQYGDITDLSRVGKLKRICEMEKASIYINMIGGKALYTQKDFHPMNLYFLVPVFEKYKQFQNNFLHGLSIIDVLMHCGFNKTSEMVGRECLEPA